jgi:hypothetical protein
MTTETLRQPAAIKRRPSRALLAWDVALLLALLFIVIAL